jgi:hypothetical protein
MKTFTTHSCPPLRYFCSLKLTVSHCITQGKDWVLSPYVLSSCGLPFPPTCQLVRGNEARSQYIRFPNNEKLKTTSKCTIEEKCKSFCIWRFSVEKICAQERSLGKEIVTESEHLGLNLLASRLIFINERVQGDTICFLQVTRSPHTHTHL